METQKTIGQLRVRTSFNPSDKSIVDLIKEKTAELIDLCEDLKKKDGRLSSLAQTAFEEGAMWAVKAATADVDTMPQYNTATGPLKVG